MELLPIVRKRRKERSPHKRAYVYKYRVDS
jgi:hypothetical protein